MTEYTPKELAMLAVFWTTSVDQCGECNEHEDLSYCNAKDLQEKLGGTMQSIGGTMSSLVDKLAIADYGESFRGDRLNDFTLIDMDAIPRHFMLNDRNDIIEAKKTS